MVIHQCNFTKLANHSENETTVSILNKTARILNINFSNVCMKRKKTHFIIVVADHGQNISYLLIQCHYVQLEFANFKVQPSTNKHRENLCLCERGEREGRGLGKNKDHVHYMDNVSNQQIFLLFFHPSLTLGPCYLNQVIAHTGPYNGLNSLPNDFANH